MFSRSPRPLLVCLLLTALPLQAEVCRQDNFDKATAVSERLMQKEEALSDRLLDYLKDARAEFFAHEQSSQHLTRQGLIGWEKQAGRSLAAQTEHMVSRLERVEALEGRLMFVEDNLPGTQNLWRLLIKHCRQEDYPERAEMARHNGRILAGLTDDLKTDRRTQAVLLDTYGKEVDLLKAANQARDQLAKQEAQRQANRAKPGEAPWPGIFDKNRKFNPEKIVWKDGIWSCAHYRADGVCSQVVRVKDIPPD